MGMKTDIFSKYIYFRTSLENRFTQISQRFSLAMKRSMYFELCRFRKRSNKERGQQPLITLPML